MTFFIYLLNSLVYNITVFTLNKKYISYIPTLYFSVIIVKVDQ